MHKEEAIDRKKTKLLKEKKKHLIKKIKGIKRKGNSCQ